MNVHHDDVVVVVTVDVLVLVLPHTTVESKGIDNLISTQTET